MGQIHLFDLASQQARWLTVRQAAVATNVANANTPGFTAGDVVPFEDVFNDSTIHMVATNPGHIGVDPLGPDQIATRDAAAWETTHSGNSVSVENEMMKAGEVNRSFSLNTSIVKAFNQMLMASVKG
ncbi:flagellar basal body rod protein FlgB [Methylocella tundrae]|uniref:Flagellar basal body rod protein FlgB n=1 Tax=Methylocella tundrae TaxID=227605 RepID=A0A4U8YUG9_METTU|nr:flagellar basal body rod protein FlgB [Methylocella tundrae]WPP04723.1 flagellar basal body rod protein FlgB [Methylocella tundrae]VFU06920.1 Flagellar basal body rod protein FlgB [Methylocella tundrae]